MNRIGKIVNGAIVLLALIALGAGCGPGVEEPTSTPAPTDTAVPPEPTDTLPPTDEPLSEPTVAVAPSGGPPGTEIQVTAAGFPAGAEVELAIGAEDAEPALTVSAEADTEGALTTALAVPTTAEADQRWVVVATAEDGDLRAVSNVFQVTAPEYDPVVTIDPTSGPSGSEVEVTAEGFPPNTSLEIGVGREDSEYDVVTTAETDGDGTLTVRVLIPDYAEADERWVVVATTEDSALKAVSDVFEVTEIVYQGTVSIRPQSGPPGTTVNVVARYFPANVPVEIGVGRVDSEYDVVATAETDGQGQLNTAIVIPDFVEPEDRWVIVVAAQEQPVKAVSDVFNVTRTEPPTPTPGGNLFTRTNVYLIAVGDAGETGMEIGCDDSVVPAEVEIEPTIAPLTAALEKLLTIDTRLYQDTGLYNALYQSNLVLQDVAIQNGEAVIRLTGTLQLGGVCDEPRVRAQLRQTALQYETVDDVSIFINGTPLEEFLTAATPTPGGNLFTRTNIYLIAIGDAGETGMEIGCDDSVVPVEVNIEPTIAPLTAALEKLLAVDTQMYEDTGLYNALYQSDLALQDVAIRGSEAVIRLTGTLQLGGVCDEPRVRAQLRQTALQYATVDEVSISINGTPLEEVLGGE
jgi:hypothetical protein